MRFQFNVLALLAGIFWVPNLRAVTPGAERVLLVVNEKSPLSRRLGDFYQGWHGLAEWQVCRIKTAIADSVAAETMSRAAYEKEIEAPVRQCIEAQAPHARPWYLVLTQGMPIRVAGKAAADWRETEQASVDSELAALYLKQSGAAVKLAGPARNPFFEQKYAQFRHPDFPVYLVTRLAGYSFEDAKRAVERCRGAKKQGVAVLDLNGDNDDMGNDWLRSAAILLPEGRSVLDTGTKVLSGIEKVMAYASWGSNDKARKSRKSGMQWLPGAIAAEYVSTSARTFTEPPRKWSLGNWSEASSWFAGSPQSMILDYVWEGVSGISGATDEPYLSLLPRPHLLIPAYLEGRNLAESFYVSLPALSWQIMILGDPLCKLQ
jgi:uncharacterized protein (TIGR03790 family)